jgi:hypothetical protein
MTLVPWSDHLRSIKFMKFKLKFNFISTLWTMVMSACEEEEARWFLTVQVKVKAKKWEM